MIAESSAVGVDSEKVIRASGYQALRESGYEVVDLKTRSAVEMPVSGGKVFDAVDPWNMPAGFRRKLDHKGVRVPVVMGGVLNQKFETLALPVDVTADLKKMGYHACPRIGYDFCRLIEFRDQTQILRPCSGASRQNER